MYIHCKIIIFLKDLRSASMHRRHIFMRKKLSLKIKNGVKSNSKENAVSHSWLVKCKKSPKIVQQLMEKTSYSSNEMKE